MITTLAPDQNQILMTTDFCKLAAEKGIHLNVKRIGKNALLSSLTIAEAKNILNNTQKKVKGIVKSKIEIIKKVLSDENNCVLFYFTSLIDYIDGILSDDFNLYKENTRNKTIEEFIKKATELPYKLKNHKKLLVLQKYFREPDSTLESVTKQLNGTGKTRERIRQIIKESLKSIVDAQREGNCFAEKIYEFYISLYCAGAKLKELDKILSYINYSIPSDQFKLLQFPKCDLIALAKKFNETDEESDIFPSDYEAFKTWLENKFEIPLYSINKNIFNSNFIFKKNDVKEVFYCNSIKNQIRYLLLIKPDGFSAAEIASQLELDAHLVSTELQRFPKLFGHPDSRRKYYLINVSFEEWMGDAFENTAQSMIKRELFDVPIPKFKNQVLEANPLLHEKIKNLDSGILAVHAVHSPRSQFVEIMRMRIGVMGCDGTYGARTPIIEAAKTLGSAFLPEELWEKVKSRFDGDRKYSYDQLIVRMQRDKILTKKRYFALKNLKFIKYENATPDARPSEKLERYLKELLSDHNYQDNYFKKFLDNACLNAKYK